MRTQSYVHSLRPCDKDAGMLSTWHLKGALTIYVSATGQNYMSVTIDSFNIVCVPLLKSGALNEHSLTAGRHRHTWWNHPTTAPVALASGHGGLRCCGSVPVP